MKNFLNKFVPTTDDEPPLYCVKMFLLSPFTVFAIGAYVALMVQTSGWIVVASVLLMICYVLVKSK